MKSQLIETEIVTDLPSITAAQIASINSFHRQANAAADAARAKAQEASHFAVLAGIRLEALKSSLPHGEWGRLFDARQIGTTRGNGSDLVLDFSVRTADKYIELAKRLRLEQQLSSKAQKRLASIADSPEPDDESRAWLAKLTEGRNLRQLYLDLDIITAPDKAPAEKQKPAPPAGPGKSQAQARLEDAREHWATWREQGEKLVRGGHLDHLDQPGLEKMKEFQGWLRDRINARLKEI